MIRITRVSDLFGKHFLRNIFTEQRVTADHGINVIDFLQPLCQIPHLIVLHIFQDQEGEGAFMEILHQFILSDYRIHVLRQIRQHIIVDTGPGHSDYRWNHQ